jgi:perosamine synthetase
MLKNGIHCGSYFQTIHLQPFYKKEFLYKKGDFPIAEDISQRTIALPFFNDLSEKDIKFVVKNLKQSINNIK